MQRRCASVASPAPAPGLWDYRADRRTGWVIWRNEEFGMYRIPLPRSLWQIKTHCDIGVKHAKANNMHLSNRIHCKTHQRQTIQHLTSRGYLTARLLEQDVAG